jgi:hypothetical protein
MAGGKAETWKVESGSQLLETNQVNRKRRLPTSSNAGGQKSKVSDQAVMKNQANHQSASRIRP